MDVQVTKLPESRVALKIELSPDEVEQALDRTYRRLAQRLNVPGFRKGKAPRPVVESMVGHEYFLHEATDEAIQWGYRQAIRQQELDPIDQAEIQVDKEEHHPHLHPGEPFHFEASVAVSPEVQLPEYHGIRVEREQEEVTDEDVETLISSLRERNATLEPTVRAAQIGDVVTMSITGRLEGEEVLKSDSFDFELRDEEGADAEPDPVLPGLSEHIAGMNRGEIKEVALSLPELYGNQDWAGKSLFLRILLKEVKRKILPAADDELAQSVSEVQTIAELRELLRSNVELERRIEADEQLVTRSINEIVTRTFVDIPPALIDEELDRMIDDLKAAFERRHIDWSRYLEVAQKTEDQMRSEMREGATNNVKTTLVLAEVANAEHIEVSNAEVDAALEDMFRTAQTSTAERRRLRSSQRVRSNVRSRLLRQKAIRKLVEIMTGGEEISSEAAEAVTESTSVGEESAESIAVEAGG